jgi:hypothetical protein
LSFVPFPLGKPAGGKCVSGAGRSHAEYLAEQAKLPTSSPGKQRSAFLRAEPILISIAWGTGQTIMTDAQSYEETVARVIALIRDAKLDVLRTFDLKSACACGPDNVCPHHGVAPCDCQLTILLVYGPYDGPVMLTGHACDGRIWFSLGYSALPQTEPSLQTVLTRLMRDERYLVEAEL